jgi:hypothetical protein
VASLIPAPRIPGGNLYSSFVIPNLIGISVFFFSLDAGRAEKTRQDE